MRQLLRDCLEEIQLIKKNSSPPGLGVILNRQGGTRTMINDYYSTTKNKVTALVAVLCTGLLMSQSAVAATTLLNFDSINEYTAVTTQYQAQGVLVSGAETIKPSEMGFPYSMSAPHVAFAMTGLMEFQLNPSIIGDIKIVSAYITGYTPVGLYAFDANDELVGQAVTPENVNVNTLLTVTSSGNPIVRVEIHDGGATFAVDNVQFETAPPPAAPSCIDVAREYYDVLLAAPKSVYSGSPALVPLKRLVLAAEIVAFSALASNKKTKKPALLALINAMEIGVKKSFKLSSQRTQLLDLLAQLKAQVNNGTCPK